jgi:outer membrane receptor protein involved in Fe transport
MKTFYHLLTVCFLFFAGNVYSSDNDKANIKITGTVMDSVTRKPVEFANIALMKADSNTPIDGAVADLDGNFTINKVAVGESYKLVVSFIGFESRTISLKVDDKKDIDLGTIIISPTPQVLKEVLVEGQKAIIEERVDRTVYNAENDATAKGGDATDVLKRVPMLSVDLDGNVSLRGNQNIQVLINNKPSTIMASSIADALKQIPADQIKSVEVITSPSAKYDAEGSAGIINIITKKNNLEGITLNIDAGLGLRGSNLGLNGNYRKGKMGFSLGGFGRANYNTFGSFENNQTVLNSETGEVRSTNLQSADTRNQGLFGNYNIGWDYDINKKNALAANVRFGVRNFENFQDDLDTRSFDSFGNLQRSTISNVHNNQESNNVDANFTYTHFYDKPQREFSVQGSFGRNNNDSEYQNIFETATGTVPTDLKNINESFNQEVTVQADYQTPIRDNQMLEFGGKNISRKVVSDFESFTRTESDGTFTRDTRSDFSNNLNYDQNVTAGYLSYTYSTKSGYSFKAGSRYEYTTINAYTATDNDIEIPSYSVLVPSINASRRLKNGNTLKLSYNRRIQRPSIRFLNPNIQRQNELIITQGNPELDPEYTNNYEIGYSTLIKGVMLNLTGFVRNTTDGIQSVRDVVEFEGKDVNRTTYQNIGNENAYGTSIFANINIGKLSLNGGGDIFYATLNNNIADPIYSASNEGWSYSGRMFGSYNLNKGWGLQLFSFYRGRQVQLQGSQTGFYMYSVAVRKEFNEKRGSIGLGIENFLQPYIKMTNEVETPVLVQNSVNKMYNSSIRLNFSYRIGKMSMDGPRRSRRSINNDDLKDGGGDGMNMNAGNEGGGQPQRAGNMPQGGPVRGNQQQQRPAPAVVSNDSVTYNAEGRWSYTIDSPQGGDGTIVINRTDSVYSGTIKNSRMPQETPLTNIQVKGNEVSFSYPVSFNGNTNNVEVKYIVTKDTIQGTMSIGGFRTFNLTGRKSE